MAKKAKANQAAAAQSTSNPRLQKGAGWEPGTDQTMWEEEKQNRESEVYAADDLSNLVANQQSKAALREIAKAAKSGIKARPQDLAEFLSDEDRFIYQQWHPGTEATPYMASGTAMPSPSVCFKNNFSQTQTEVIGSNLDSEPLGTADYTVIAFCPIFSMLNGSGQNDRYATTEKLSGLIFTQSDSVDEPGIDLSWFDEVKYSRNMLEVYGSDCTGFATAGFVWSAAMHVRTLAPLANLVGSYYKGAITVGQLGSTGRISIRDLIEIAGTAGTHSSDVVLQSSVVNRNLVFSGSTNVELNHDVATLSQSYQQEVVQYLILQRPVQNITTGTNSAFSLMMSVKGNAVIWPNARDSIANGLSHALLGQAHSHPASAARRHNLLPAVNESHIAKMPLPKRNGEGVLDRLRRLIEYAWKHKDTVIGGLSTAAQVIGPMLLAKGVASNELDTTFVRISYQDALIKLRADLEYFKRDDSMAGPIEALLAQMEKNTSVIESPEYRGKRLIPESAFLVVKQPQTPSSSTVTLRTRA